MELSCPVSWAMMRSTGPPGANCTMVKLISMIPNTNAEDNFVGFNIFR
jgi:hypothetical protein